MVFVLLVVVAVGSVVAGRAILEGNILEEICKGTSINSAAISKGLVIQQVDGGWMDR